MSGRRTVRNEGTNSRGNWYRAYDDGAYRYKNTDGGRYFNDGQDHGFYKSVYSRDNCFADNQTLWTLYLFWFIVCQTHNISRCSRDGTQASGGESYSRYYDYKSGSTRTYSGDKTGASSSYSDRFVRKYRFHKFILNVKGKE